MVDPADRGETLGDQLRSIECADVMDAWAALEIGRSGVVGLGWTIPSSGASVYAHFAPNVRVSAALIAGSKGSSRARQAKTCWVLRVPPRS